MNQGPEITHQGGEVEATVMVPAIAGRGPLLAYSIGSVLAQSVSAIEVFVIGDGVEDADRQIIGELQDRDARIKFFDNGKHERRGEPYRHAALNEASGRIVCYLCDRDIMLPHHVETMLRLLENADFAHTLISAISQSGQLRFRAGINLADQTDREWILETPCAENSIPLSFAGHTLEFYKKLPHGWRTTPPDLGTDVYMWEQFLAEQDCRAISGAVPTVLYFPRYWRKDWTTDQKLEELEKWQRAVNSPHWQQEYSQMVIKNLYEERINYGRNLRRMGNRLHAMAETYNQIIGSR